MTDRDPSHCPGRPAERDPRRRRRLRRAVRRGVARKDRRDDPATLDHRRRMPIDDLTNCSRRASICGWEPKAWRVRASFPPRARGRSGSRSAHRACRRRDSISKARARSWKRAASMSCRLIEHLAICPKASRASPIRRSSTGRLDIFHAADHRSSPRFSTMSHAAIAGPLYRGDFAAQLSRCGCGAVQSSTRSGSGAGTRARAGMLDFALEDKDLRPAATSWRRAACRRRTAAAWRASSCASRCRERRSAPSIGYRAQKHTDPIDVDRVGVLDPRRFLGRRSIGARGCVG